MIKDRAKKDDIYEINTEEEIKKDLERFFKYNRGFEQKTFYFDGGGANYYEFYGSNTDKLPHLKISYNSSKIFDFLKKNILVHKKKIALISLGCGNANREKEILNKMTDAGFDVSYFGVDSSKYMIQSGMDNLKNCSFPKKFIFADFSLEKFKMRFEKTFKEFDIRIFAFLGGTLCNAPQDYMADVLRNMLKKDDILWIDASIKTQNSTALAGEYFERYLKYVQDPNWKKFVSFPLEHLGIKIDAGDLILQMDKEHPLNTFLFKFGFVLNQKNEVEINKEIVTLLKDDIVGLFRIRIYDLPSLISFFELRDFELIDKLVINNKAQILFKKK